MERRRRRRAGGLRAARPSPRPRRVARGVVRRRIVAAYTLVGFTILVIALGAAAERGQRAALRRHRHPRLRRVGQHGRRRPGPDPDGGRQGRRPRRSSARQPATVEIGVVAFSDSGFSVQVPTEDPTQVLAAIDRLTPQRGTSIGSGISAVADDDRDRPAGPGRRLLHEPLARRRAPTCHRSRRAPTPRPRSCC